MGGVVRQHSALDRTLRREQIFRRHEARGAHIHQLAIWQDNKFMRRIAVSADLPALISLEHAKPGAPQTLYQVFLLPSM